MQRNWYDIWRIHHEGENDESFAYVRLSLRCCLTTVFDIIYIPGFRDLHSLDISDCISIDPTSVIDVMDGFYALKMFIYRNCPQFSQYHIQRVVELSQNSLEIVDGTGSGRILPTIIIGMLYRIPDCKRFWVSPSEGEEAMWEKILIQFCRVDFGPQVAALVPNLVQLRFVSKMLSEA